MEGEKMKSSRIVLLVIAALISGCSHSSTINTAELSEDMYIDSGKRMNDVWIIWEDGSKVEGDYVTINKAEISWTDMNSHKLLTRPISEVDEIVSFKHPAGAWDGFLLGALAGVTLGIYAGNSFAEDHGLIGSILEDEIYKIGAIYFGFWGSVIGTPTGFVIGERIRYKLKTEEPKGVTLPEVKE